MSDKKAYLTFEKECPKCKHLLTIEVDKQTESPVYTISIQGQGNLFGKEEKAKDKAKKGKKPAKKNTPKKGR